jgi:hypothetical protein
LTNASSGVKALAWMPDGQSYFASGDQVVNYSTCDDQNPKAVAGTPINLDTTAIGGVPHAVGLSGSQWYDYSVTTTAQVGDQAVTQLSFPPLVSGGAGNVCLSTVTVNANAPTAGVSTLKSTASQVTFSPTLEQEFVTGVSSTGATAESVIHGYDVIAQAEFTLATATPIIPLSGGVLNDGRKLYIGSNGTTPNSAVLHRFDLSTGTGTTGTRAEDASASVAVVPNFVAVVPK